MPRLLQLSLLLALGGLLNAQTQAGSTAAGPADSGTGKGSNVGAQIGDRDPLLDLPPLPHNKVSLIGGTVTNLDRIQDRLTVQPFGDKQKMHLAYDVRTRFFRDGKPSHQREIKPGERVYVDSMLDGTRVFAKTIWIETGAASGSGRGQIVGYDAQAGMLTVRDELSAQPMTFRVNSSTAVRQGSETRSLANLMPGSLVTLSFDSRQGQQGVVREITVLAQPGSEFSFFGKITYMDLSRKLIAVANEPDRQTYDIYLQGMPTSEIRDLRTGSEVGISAVFDGRHYVARSIKMVASGQPAAER
jgi:hypothetical protein